MIQEPSPTTEQPQPDLGIQGTVVSAQNPMVVRISGDQLDDQEKAVENASQAPAPVVSELAAHVQKCFEKAERARTSVEQEMLDDLRQRKGEYDQHMKDLIEKSGQVEIFDNVTEVKCYAGESWIKDILIFQPSSHPWGIEPTPIPDLSPVDEQRIVANVMGRVQQAVAQSGKFPDQKQIFQLAVDMRESMVKQRVNAAKEKADKMETAIADVLSEGKFDEAFNDFIYYFTTFSVGIMKGPVVRVEPGIKWMTFQGKTKPVIVNKMIDTIEAVNPLDCYPDPLSVEIDDGYFIERKRMSLQSVRDMRDIPGYSIEELDAVIAEYPAGTNNWSPIDAQRSTLEDKDNTFEQQNFIVCLEYWDKIDGKLLNDWLQYHATDLKAPMTFEAGKNYPIMAEVIGNHVIKAIINPDPTGKKPYFKAPFRKVSGSFWGRSLPRLIRDHQKIINSLARAAVRNIALAAGPQADVDVGRMAAGEDYTSIYPGKVWQTESRGTNYTNPAVKFFQPEYIASELFAQRDRAVRNMDESSGVPPYTYGNDQVAGAGRTASGLDMLMGAANRGIKNAIYAIDIGIIKPMIYRIWVYKMLYDSDESIKGDMNIVCKGAIANFIKERVSLRRNELLAMSSQNQAILALIGNTGLAKLLTETYKASDVNPDGIVPTQDEVRQKERILAQQQQAMLQQQAAQQQAQQRQQQQGGQQRQ